MTEGRKRWTGDVPVEDDFRKPIVDEFVDGRTIAGQWAFMAPESWEAYGVGKLGTGYGQRYRKEGEHWYKVEG